MIVLNDPTFGNLFVLVPQRDGGDKGEDRIYYIIIVYPLYNITFYPNIRVVFRAILGVEFPVA